MNLPTIIEQFLKSFEAEVPFLDIAIAVNENPDYQKSYRTKLDSTDIATIARHYTDYFIVSSRGVQAKMRGSGTWSVDMRQASRMRSGYLGYFKHDRVSGLIRNFIRGISDLNRHLDVSLEIIIKTANQFSIVIRSEKVNEILSMFSKKNPNTDIITPVYLSKTAKIICGDSSIEFKKGLLVTESDFSEERALQFIQLDFELDHEVLEDMSLIYFELAAQIKELGQLHRNCKILLRDERTQPFQQNIFHFPEGVFYTYHLLKKKIGYIRPSQFEFIYDNTVNGNAYQIAFACYDAGAGPTFVSSANKWTLNQAGPMANGVIDALIASLKKYIRQEFLKNFDLFKQHLEAEMGYAFTIDDSENPDPRKQFEFRKSEVKRALIMVCAIKCDEIILDPLSGYSKYEPKSIGKEIKKEIEAIIYPKLVAESEMTLKFLTRFLIRPNLDSIFKSASISE